MEPTTPTVRELDDRKFALLGNSFGSENDSATLSIHRTSSLDARQPLIEFSHHGSRDFVPILSDLKKTSDPRWPGKISTGKWMTYVVSRLNSIAERSDHPGYPHPESFAAIWFRIWDLLSPLTPAPSVVPSGAGGIRLIWHRNGWDIDVEVDENGWSFWAENDEASGILEGGNSFDARSHLRDVLELLRTDE